MTELRGWGPVIGELDCGGQVWCCEALWRCWSEALEMFGRGGLWGSIQRQPL